MPPRLRVIEGGKSNPKQTRISMIVTCGIEDTERLRAALDEVSQKIRVSKTIRGSAVDGFAWTIGEIK